jgi:hypothetical protein
VSSAQRAFLDANIIIEAFRIGAWPELSRGSWLETVQECEQEALTGNTARSGRVAVDPLALRSGLKASHNVGRQERNKLTHDYPKCASMDPGERDLFAYLYSHESPLPASVVLSTADKGVVVRANDLGWLDNIVSLHDLLVAANVASAKIALLDRQFQVAFLSKVRTDVRMGVIP